MVSNEPTTAAVPRFTPSLRLPVTSCQSAPILFIYLKKKVEFIAQCSESLCLRERVSAAGSSLLALARNNCQFILSQPFHHAGETDRLGPSETPEDSKPTSH